MIMQFRPYQHIEKFGTSEVRDIEKGHCWIFPKIDGTNSSVWLGDDGFVHCGSRNKEITIEDDNRGFAKYISECEDFRNFLTTYPNLRVYGKWLVPHTIKDYQEYAWRKFHVFDVYDESTEKYLSFLEYIPLFMYYKDIWILAPINDIENPSLETLHNLMEKNTYLMQDGSIGEGIVIKNYDFVNKYGRTTWAKMVRAEFKENHTGKTQNPSQKENLGPEEAIANKYITETLVRKEAAKLAEDWDRKNIPRLLSTLFYCLVKEEMWEIVKDFKSPTINFKLLQSYVNIRIKKVAPELF
jgi:hypothetical protein